MIHGLPPTSGLVISSDTVNRSATQPEYIVSTTTNLIDTVSKIAKEVGELLRDVPYVKAFAGIILQIITIREDIRTEKDRSRELVHKILRRSKVLLDGLLQIAASPNRDQLKDTEAKLEEYNCLLEQILGTFTANIPNGMRAKFNRVVSRNARIETLAMYDRRVDDFNMDFITDLLLKLRVANTSQLNGSIQAPSGPASILYKPIPRPDQMVGRDEEKARVIETLINQTSPRLAILGVGGMGKTTLALTVLHDRAVIERYSSRYFVSCEAVTSLSGLIWEIANALRIPLAERNEHLIDTVLTQFGEDSILCLDNLETVWEDETIRRDVEDVLSHFNHLPRRGIIITMRGAQRPSGLSWSEPLLPPLEKLRDIDSKLIFQKTSIPVDEFTDNLLQVANGIPLAIKLIIAQLRDGDERPESLWARWQRIQTSAIKTGNKHRLSNLDASIHLSVYSPRMQADPNAIPIFAMLSNLPDGFSCRQATIDKLQSYLPETIRLQEVLETLRLVSLVYVDRTKGRLRYRMLVPIREFGMKLHIEHPLNHCLVDFYTEIIIRFADYTDPASHGIIPLELLNIHSVFTSELNEGKVDEKIVNASIHYTHWSLFTGNPTEELIDLVKRKTIGMSAPHTRCISALAQVYLREHKLDEAKSSFTQAIRLHRQSHDVLGEANDVHMLGEVYLRQDKLDEAKSFFTRAVELHRRSHSVLGEANDVQYLGEVYLRRDKLDEAESSFMRAVVLYRQLHSVLGEANGVQKLGEVYLRRDKLEEAEWAFTTAIELHRQSHAVLGEANDVQMLGEVYLRQHKLGDAGSSFTRAIQLHRQSHAVFGEANDVQKLGEVYLRQDKLVEAESSFTKAIELHRQSHSVLGEANDIQNLGKVYLRQHRLDDAESALTRAIELHRQSRAVLGMANDVQKLGEVYLRRHKLAEAESAFMRAIELHRQSHAALGVANDIQKLGKVYLRQHKLDEAEQSFNQALLLHRQSQSSRGETADLRLIRRARKRRDMLLPAQPVATV